MYRTLVLFALLCTCSLRTWSSTPADPLRIPQQANETTVYITGGDRHYHRAGCERVKHDKHGVILSDAKAAGYTSCGLCKAVK